MHGNRKLCRTFLGKCIGAPYKILTTKKPPNFAVRGLFFWLIIRLLLQLVLVAAERLPDLEFSLSLDC
jgi:hypothetical protein